MVNKSTSVLKWSPREFSQPIPTLEINVFGKLCEIDAFGEAFVQIELDGPTAAGAAVSLGDRTERLDDAVIVGGEGAECGENLLKTLRFKDVFRLGIGIV